MSIRSIRRLSEAQPVIEGAGVHLRRAFGFGDTSELDPFLLFDDFRNDRPERYEAGFPWHPHRGMETITYVLRGEVEHRDSLGNEGVLGPGEVQWMTAGRGIIHQEMPRGDERGHMHGFQLWANLPAALKLSEARYQEFGAERIPLVEREGSRVRVICGSYLDRRGPVEGIAAEPSYLDVSLETGARESFAVAAGRHAFAYVFEGRARFGEGGAAREARDRSLVVFGDGDEVRAEALEPGARFLLISGTPLAEPVAWRGPIVMNTQEELRRAFEEVQSGHFLDARG